MSDPVLETRGLSKRFGALEASKSVSLTLCPGEIHALIGPNGAGKSTLIAQIAGALKPDNGSVHLCGEDITHLSTPARARAGLARTFQVSQLAMQDTVLQNALLGATATNGRPFRLWGRPVDTLRQRAQAALTRVGLAGQAATPVSALSHGQRRLLELAIALTLEPKAFLLDEPMAGLGSEGSQNMTDFLATLRTQAPILLVEHDMDAVFALADRISVLVYGEVIATGTTDEIRANPVVREAYLGQDA
ncbi:ABC transporter ATP-binding protein [Algicella marina]|uniref:ATP-binding cassette domain-containing protein n=1 Tax=Algicella marina TaxID=2683284 RepID=A0A6P1SUX2_9RHOB|nr:ABC transporter ATP-binding protein [Algicella marina]QHQ34248.1 ATP-binding cassette domain-containing protein [Algicella marina]